MKLEHIAEEFDQCIKCGLCLATCPVGKELFLEKYTPRGKIQLAKFYGRESLDLSAHCRDIFAKCLLCGSCSVTCPSGVDLNKVFVSMRERIADRRGFHPRVRQALDSLLENHNISEDANQERGEWREDMRDLPADMYEKDRAATAYFVGCVASFFPTVQSIPRAVAGILTAAGLDFAVLAGDEWCCGFPLIGAGAPEKARALMQHNLEKINALGAERVVFSCPSCLRSWKEYYDPDLELLHDSEILDNLLSEGRLEFQELNLTVTYHDPCDLGKNSGVYEAPRKVLEAVPGLSLVELENNRDRSICCGGGGNVEMVAAPLSESIARRKIEEIQATGASTVVTACQQCVRTMQTYLRRHKTALEVLDIAQLVQRALKHDT